MNGRPIPESAPRAVLVKMGDGKWKIELREFSGFRDRLGADVLNAFARRFVHVDRLQSLASLLALSEDRYGRDSLPLSATCTRLYCSRSEPYVRLLPQFGASGAPWQGADYST